jgi:UDP-2,3-diacylglucosamine pyrophosphatase LpxH
MKTLTALTPSCLIDKAEDPPISIERYYKRILPEPEDTSDRLIHPQHRYRSVFISDLHLGTASTRAAELVQFLNHVKTEYLFLVGDVFDLWKLRIFNPLKLGKLLGTGVFSRTQLTVIQKLLRADRHGTKTIMVPGNHDEVLRDFVGMHLNNIVLVLDAVHETRNGRRFLVMHGDSFDAMVRRHRWLGILGTHAFEAIAKLSIQIDRWRKYARINRALEYLGLESHWSLADAIKTRADGHAYTASYSQAMLGYLFARNAEIYARHKKQPRTHAGAYFDGIICGHTHIPEVRDFPSPIDEETGEPIGPATVTYLNTGHWTGHLDEDRSEAIHYESSDAPICTAIVEHLDGQLESVRWVSQKGILPLTVNCQHEEKRRLASAPV